MTKIILMLKSYMFLSKKLLKLQAPATKATKAGSARSARKGSLATGNSNVADVLHSLRI